MITACQQREAVVKIGGAIDGDAVREFSMLIAAVRPVGVSAEANLHKPCEARASSSMLATRRRCAAGDRLKKRQ